MPAANRSGFLVVVNTLYALGTLLYEISVGHQLYAGKTSRETQKLLESHEFPDLQSIPTDIREIIKRCWSNEYQSAEEAIRDLPAMFN